MRVKNSEFIISATSKKQYPTDAVKQVVLVGKSNVGKSSFINTIVNRKNLARTSSQPGKTRLINFYKVYANDKNENESNFHFVDLPGYGYSKMSKKEQLEVGSFIEDYLEKSKNISLIIFLIDIRHKPTAEDKMMYDYIIKNGLNCIIVCNKADKIAITKVDDRVKELQEILNPMKDFEFLPFSSQRKIYTDALLDKIEESILD